MGACSTIKVTRTAAQKYLLARTMEATDEELGNALGQFLAERLYNAYVVPDNETENDDEVLDG